MKPSFKKIAIAVLATAAIALPITADAHRQWLLPSATVLSGSDPWVTVDAAISNDLFYFEHFPMQLQNLVVVAPDGKPAEAQNQSTGRYRSTFDVHLTQDGTYRIAVVNDRMFATYTLKGERKRWMGTAEKISAEIPAEAEGLNVTDAQGRVEIFVTKGNPTNDALKLTGRGLELQPITHPNDLVANNQASFKMMLDGKPAKDVKVEIVRGGIRYRDKLEDTNVTTDGEGKFSVTWPEPGMYWIEASVADKSTVSKQAKERRASYIATLEVLPE